MELQDVFGSGAAVELVDVLSDDGDRAPLFGEPLLALSDGHVGGVGVFCQHDLTAIVIKLPHTGGVPGEGLRGGKFLTPNTAEEADEMFAQSIFFLKCCLADFIQWLIFTAHVAVLVHS